MSNAAPYNFVDTWKSLAPEWLTEGDAEKYMFALQLCSDILLDKADQAAKIGIPGVGDPSNLPYLGEDRLLVQGTNESNASFTVRLQQSFATWKKAGSAQSILGQLQPLLLGMQPGVAATLPAMTIVGGNSAYAKWVTSYQGDAVGQPPTLTTTAGSIFNWDGANKPWRAWLVLYMYAVPTGAAGTALSIGAASGTGYGTGHTVAGGWAPNTASPLNTPFFAITGLTGAAVGQWITLSGFANPGNNGTFPIVASSGPTMGVVANPNGVANDGPGTWSTAVYPWIGPAMPWSTLGPTFGQGELVAPPLDTGSLVGGIWEPSVVSISGTFNVASWGLTCPAATIQGIRQILARWKRANTYYPDILIAFDGGTGAAGGAFSPNSTPGSGNPDGTFGGRGKNVGGVWVPNRLISSPYDAWCQGTGYHPGGSSEVT